MGDQQPKSVSDETSKDGARRLTHRPFARLKMRQLQEKEADAHERRMDASLPVDPEELEATLKRLDELTSK